MFVALWSSGVILTMQSHSVPKLRFRGSLVDCSPNSNLRWLGNFFKMLSVPMKEEISLSRPALVRLEMTWKTSILLMLLANLNLQLPISAVRSCPWSSPVKLDKGEHPSYLTEQTSTLLCRSFFERSNLYLCCSDRISTVIRVSGAWSFI